MNLSLPVPLCSVSHALGFLIGPAVHGGTEIEVELGGVLSYPARRRIDGYAKKVFFDR